MGYKKNEEQLHYIQIQHKIVCILFDANDVANQAEIKSNQNTNTSQ